MESNNSLNADKYIFDLRKLFIISFALGITSIIAFTLAPLSDAARAVTVLIPVLIIIIYAVIGSKNVGKDREQTSDQLADSCYFLGFLFTLSSLIATLVFLSISNNDTGRIDVFSVLMSFALALVTTIVGLVCRILLTQFSTTLTQERKKALGDLTAATQQFRVKLDNSTRKIDNYLESANAKILATNEIAVAELTELSKRHSSELLEVLKELNVAQDQTTRKTINKTEELFTSINQGLQAYELSTKSFSVALDEPKNEITASLDSFTKALVSTEKSLSDFQTNILKNSSSFDFDTNFAKKASDLFDYVELSSNTSTKNMEALTKTADQLQSGSGKLSERMEDMAASMDKSLNAIENMTAIVPNKLISDEYSDSLEKSLADQKYAIDFLSGQINQLAQTVRKADSLVAEEFQKQSTKRGFFNR